MRTESGPFSAILLVFLSVALVTACYLMSQAPQPTNAGTSSYSEFGSPTCSTYLSTPYDC